MTKTYEKIVDLSLDNAYPIYPDQLKTFIFNSSSANFLQKIIHCHINPPCAVYQLEYIEGLSLYDSLMMNLDSPVKFIQIFNDCLSWFNDHCVYKVDKYTLMLNGDSHPGNIILTPDNKYIMIDYLSDFLVLTEEQNRIYFGFLNFLKKHEKATSSIVNQLELPQSIKDIFFESISIDDISDLSDQYVHYSRDHFIKNSLANVHHDLHIKFQNILLHFNYDISKDINFFKNKV